MEKVKDWNLGVFSVFMEDCKPLICGICFILQERKEDFLELFDIFLNTAGSFPQTIITDQQFTVISALKDFKENKQLNFAHLLDQFHIIRNADKSIGSEDPETKTMETFKKMIYNDSQLEWEQARNQLLSEEGN